MKLTRRFLCLSPLVLGTFLSLNAVPDRYIPGQIEEMASVPGDQIRFIVLPDRTGGSRDSVFEQAVEAIGRLHPDFVVTVGDQIEGYTEEKATLQGQWDAYLSDIDGLECPFLLTPGNHDNLYPKQRELWGDIIGPDYYHYRVGDFLFLHLDSQDNKSGGHYQTGIGEAQLKYMAGALEENADASWTFVLLHQPIWSVLDDARAVEADGSVTRGRHQITDFTDNGNWDKLEKLLQQRKHTVFSGHEHFYRFEERGGNGYFTLATAGGISPLNGLGDGTFDHLTMVTIEAGGTPVVANLLLDGILSPDVVSAEDGILLNSLEELIPEPAVEPLFLDLTKDVDSVVSVNLRNPSQHPLQYDLSGENLGGFLIGKNRFSGTILPGDKALLELPVSRRAGDPLPAGAGVQVHLAYRIPLEGKACFEKNFVCDAIFRVPGPGSILAMKSDKDHGTEFLMDGDLSTYWTFYGRDARFVYALQEERELDSIRLAFFNGDKRQAYFEIRGSRNLTDWETLYAGSSSGETSGFEAFRFEKPAKVRYLCFIGHGNSANQWNSVLEMALGN